MTNSTLERRALYHRFVEILDAIGLYTTHPAMSPITSKGYAMVDLQKCLAQLTQQGQSIQTAVSRTDPEQARWKPDAESWSILEVINHLCDEEREDFRTRLKHILNNEEGLPPAINPVGWVIERQYNTRDLTASLTDFLNEREQSVRWLRSLSAINWDTAVEGPFGRIRAGDILMAWLAHDLLHLRQIVELQYAYHKQQAFPYQVEYAGEW